jgi:hypothetical protein
LEGVFPSRAVSRWPRVTKHAESTENIASNWVGPASSNAPSRSTRRIGSRDSIVILDASRAFQVARIKVQCRHDERFVNARRVNPNNFFAELKRRNVYKVAIAYGVVAWLLMQVASQIFPFFEIPNWAVRLVVLLLIIGFPIALIIAWAFELTPEGL